MKRTRFLLVPLVLLAAIAPAPAGAQSEVTASALVEIATALDRIAEAMERQIESGRLDLLMRRQESSQRRLDLIDNRLRGVRRERESIQQNLERTERDLARLSDPANAEAIGFDAATLEAQIEMMEFEADLERRRSAELDAEVARLENERVQRRREVEDWQAFLDRELSGLQ